VFRRIEQRLRGTAHVNEARPGTSQSRCHNNNCVTRAIQNLVRCRTRIWIIPTDGPRSSSRRPTACTYISLFAESMFPADRPIQTQVCYTKTLRMRRDKACFTRDGVFNVHNSHLWACANPNANSKPVYQVRFIISISFWVGILEEIVVGFLSATWQTDCSTISTGPAWRCASSYGTEIVVSTLRSSKSLLGTCSAVVERDISKKVDSTSRTAARPPLSADQCPMTCILKTKGHRTYAVQYFRLNFNKESQSGIHLR
jgi:hypothetical protein